MISDFKILPNNVFETAVLWCIVALTAILRLLHKRENTTFLQFVFVIIA